MAAFFSPFCTTDSRERSSLPEGGAACRHHHNWSQYGANAQQVRQVVDSWLAYVNPENGFSGDSCYKGGCGNPAHRGGCAGMEESKLDV
jgi:hypothetical protein